MEAVTFLRHDLASLSKNGANSAFHPAHLAVTVVMARGFCAVPRGDDRHQHECGRGDENED
jgi:hypothetical protein